MDMEYWRGLLLIVLILAGLAGSVWAIVRRMRATQEASTELRAPLRREPTSPRRSIAVFALGPEERRRLAWLEVKHSYVSNGRWFTVVIAIMACLSALACLATAMTGGPEARPAAYWLSSVPAGMLLWWLWVLPLLLRVRMTEAVVVLENGLMFRARNPQSAARDTEGRVDETAALDDWLVLGDRSRKWEDLEAVTYDEMSGELRFHDRQTEPEGHTIISVTRVPIPRSQRRELNFALERLPQFRADEARDDRLEWLVMTGVIIGIGALIVVVSIGASMLLPRCG